MTDIEACVAINMIPKMGPVRLRKLLEVFRTPQRILAAKTHELRGVDGIGKEVAEAVAGWEQHVDLAAEMKRVAEFGAHVITQSSPEFPPALREIHSAPIVLYVWGKLEPRDGRHAIGVVGSRHASHYGLECAKKLSYQLAYAGVTVVSGLARGIDTAAHQGALAAGGRTAAVLGSGFLKIYPRENIGLAEKIADGSGAVISEFPMEASADPQTFPMRNRIVAGWGSGVLVVEAGMNSGALITAGQATDCGRNVYAIPGQIDRPTCAGSNRLIQQGAKLITSASDILDDMQMLLPPVAQPQPDAQQPQRAEAAESRASSLGAEERLVFDALDLSETGIDDIIAKTGLPTAKVSSTLLVLEMKRLVRQLPGQHFVKLG